MKALVYQRDVGRGPKRGQHAGRLGAGTATT